MAKIYIEEGKLKSSKSCQLCVHKDTCRFHAKTKELFKSNEFYEMTEYLEWNNNLQAWEENSSCQFYNSFLWTKNLFEKEVKKSKSYINAHDWWNIITQYFKEVYFEKYKAYFDNERLIQKQKSHLKNISDEKLFPHCVNRSTSTGKIFTIKSKDGSWEENISLVEVLQYFNAWKN